MLYTIGLFLWPPKCKNIEFRNHVVKVNLHYACSEWRLDDHFSRNLTLEKEKSGILGEALGTMDILALNLKYLIAYDERLGSIAPFDNLSIAFHLQNIFSSSVPSLTLRLVFWGLKPRWRSILSCSAFSYSVISLSAAFQRLIFKCHHYEVVRHHKMC